MRIGFIGVGTMGRPMAGHLQAAGHELYLLRHRSTLPQDLLDRGAVACNSPREVAEAAELVILMLPNTPDVEQVLFKPGGIVEAVRAGQVLVDMSSIDPLATRRFAERFEALGCSYLDAPVSGGEIGAKDATLTIMCGGAPTVFERVRPVLELLGRSVTLVGRVGDGQVAKVANQIIVALNIEAVAEALVFAARAGANPARVRQAIAGGFAGSRVLEVHGERMLSRAFKPGFRIELHQKDLELALTAAKALSVPLPNTSTVLQLLNACVAHGGGRRDHSSMVTALEMLARVSLGESGLAQ